MKDGELRMNGLFDKIYGCIAGSNIGSAMGAAVEGWSAERITEKYGVLEELLPYSHYRKSEKGGGRQRPPGTTEDGIERQKLMCTAIIEKSDRISAEDLARVWIRDINPDNFGVQMQPTDVTMYRLLKAGETFDVTGTPSSVPPTELGRYSVAPGTVAFARSCHPLGIINAANPDQAFEDAFEIGKMYLPPHDVGLYWSAAVAVAIAEALKPDATVESVIEKVKSYLPYQVVEELDFGLQVAEKSKDVFEMRAPLNEKYCNMAGLNPMSKAHEIVTKGFAIFYKTNANVRESIVGSANFGRDTDCLAAVTGGIAGSLSGTKDIPEEWIRSVDEATAAMEDRYSVSALSLRETSQGLYDALMAHVDLQRERIRLLDIYSSP